MPIAPKVLFEDNHLLMVDKPAGMITQGAGEGDEGLVAWAKEYLKQKYAKPGNVFLGVVSRLDACVSGVVVLARTSKAAARLTELFRTRGVEKTYWAMVENRPLPATGERVNWLWHNDACHRVDVVDSASSHADAKEARLSYRTLGHVGGNTLLEIQLLTGRKHQIRVQLAAWGFPIIGDRKYGSGREFRFGIALHARRLALTHPVAKTRVECVADVPASWNAWRTWLPQS